MTKMQEARQVTYAPVARKCERLSTRTSARSDGRPGARSCAHSGAQASFYKTFRVIFEKTLFDTSFWPKNPPSEWIWQQSQNTARLLPGKMKNTYFPTALRRHWNSCQNGNFCNFSYLLLFKPRLTTPPKKNGDSNDKFPGHSIITRFTTLLNALACNSQTLRPNFLFIYEHLELLLGLFFLALTSFKYKQPF